MKNNIIALLVMLSLSAGAQDSLEVKRLVSFSPQYLINYGIRVDFERKILANKWLVIAPEIYLSDNSNGNAEENTASDDFNLLAGVGLYSGLKTYSRSRTLPGSYLGYGLTYTYFYAEYYEDFENEVTKVEADIQKMGFDITLGYQFIVKGVAVIDLYTGMGLRMSFINNGEFSNDKFDNYPTGYNMTGNILLAGIKIGILY